MDKVLLSADAEAIVTMDLIPWQKANRDFHRLLDYCIEEALWGTNKRFKFFGTIIFTNKRNFYEKVLHPEQHPLAYVQLIHQTEECVQCCLCPAPL